MSDFFYNLPKSRQHIIALSILFTLPLILFFQTTIGGKELSRHDITQWRAGAESIIEYREEFGEEPLWATNMFAGMPAYPISTKLQVPHLDHFVQYFSPIYPAFQFWVMLGGMYLLLVLMGFRSLSAICGSILFSFTTYFPVIIMAGHTSKFFALALVPWTIVGYWLMTRFEKKKLLGLLVFSASLALEVRAGHPQITYYFMFLIGGLWAFDTFNYFKKKQYKVWGIITAFLIIGGVVGILGSSERILSLQSYTPYSIRGGSDLENTSGLDESYAFAWSQGVAETITLVIPNAFGGASPDYWGPKSITSGPHYLGVLTLLFMLIALFKVREKVIYVFLIVGTLAIFFAWGSNFMLLNHFAFEYIPFFDKFRAPETWLVVTALCFTIVAIYGIEKFYDSIKDKNYTFRKLYAPLGTTIVVYFALFLGVNSLDFVKLGEIENLAYQIAQQNQISPDNPQVQQRAIQIINEQIVPSREEKANSDSLRLGLFLILGMGLLYGASTNRLSSTMVGFSFILIASVDMISVGQRYMSERNIVNSNVNTKQEILSKARDLDLYIEENVQKNTIYPYRVLPLLDNYFAEAVPSYFYPTLGGYSGAKLSIAQDVLEPGGPIFGGRTGINLGLLEVLNTKYLMYNPGITIEGLTPVFQSNTGVVYELDNVLPKAFFVDSVVTVDTPEEAFELLAPDRIDFSSTAVVENFAPSIAPDSLARLEIVKYTSKEISMEIERSTPGFLVLSEVYYPNGWIAELNGSEIPIHKTNYLLRGFQIPAGNHLLTLDFRPTSFYTGVKLSWLSLVFQVLLGAFLASTYFKKKSNTKNE